MRHLVLFSVLLLGTSWAAAQTSPSQGTGGSSGQETVKGCLSNSGGSYMLTDKNGKSFQLTGDTSKLSDHVGHEIKVTGTAGSASASPGADIRPRSSNAVHSAWWFADTRRPPAFRR